MKSLANYAKEFVLPIASLVGLFYAFDVYIIERAKTVVEPTQIKVESMKEDLKEIKDRTRNIESILMRGK